MLIYAIVDLCYDYFQLFVLRINIMFRFFFLLFYIYLIRIGNRFKFEVIFKYVFCCLNSFMFNEFSKVSQSQIHYAKRSKIFGRCSRFWNGDIIRQWYITLNEFLGTIYLNLLVDFKLVLFNINQRRTRKKCYRAIVYEDLISEHTELYTQAKTINTFLHELRVSLKSRGRFKVPKKLGVFRNARLERKKALIDPRTKKSTVTILQPIVLYPVCVSFEYKRLKLFIFLFKSAKLQINNCIYIRLAREFILSFFDISLSCFVVTEIREITVSHQYDVKF